MLVEMYELSKNEHQSFMSCFENIFKEHPRKFHDFETICEEICRQRPEYKRPGKPPLSERVKHFLFTLPLGTGNISIYRRANAIYRFRLQVPIENQTMFVDHAMAIFGNDNRLVKYFDSRKVIFAVPLTRKIISYIVSVRGNYTVTMPFQELVNGFAMKLIHPITINLAERFREILVEIQAINRMDNKIRIQILMMTETPITELFEQRIQSSILIDERRRILQYSSKSMEVPLQRTYDQNPTARLEPIQNLPDMIKAEATKNFSNSTIINVREDLLSSQEDLSTLSTSNSTRTLTQLAPAPVSNPKTSTTTACLTPQAALSMLKTAFVKKVKRFEKKSPSANNTLITATPTSNENFIGSLLEQTVSTPRIVTVQNQLMIENGVLPRTICLGTPTTNGSKNDSVLGLQIPSSPEMHEPVTEPVPDNRSSGLEQKDELNQIGSELEVFDSPSTLKWTASVSDLSQNDTVPSEECSISSVPSQEIKRTISEMTAVLLLDTSSFRQENEMKGSKKVTSNLKRFHPDASPRQLTAKKAKTVVEDASSNVEHSGKILRQLILDDAEVNKTENSQLPLQPGHTSTKDILLTLRSGVVSLGMMELKELEKEMTETVEKVGEKAIPIKTVISTLSTTLKKAALPMEHIDDEATSILAWNVVKVIFPIALALKKYTESFPFLEVLYKDVEKADKWLSETKKKIPITETESLFRHWIVAMRDSS